jgi:hypothetical protein
VDISLYLVEQLCHENYLNKHVLQDP